MRLNSVNPIVVLIVTGMMVIPGAVVGTPAVVQDQLFPEQPPDITVEPAPGAEQYVTNTTQTANGNTNISIEVANPGVNADAITEFQELLVITHTDNANAGPVTVTVEQQDPQLTVGHDLTSLEPDDGVGAAGSNFTLTPGESETLGLEVNTMDVDVGNTLTTTLTIKTQVAETGPISDPIPPTLINDSGPPAAEATVEIDTGADGEVPVGQPVDLTATGSTIPSLSSLVEAQVDIPTENPAVIDGPFNLSAGDSAVTPEGAVEFSLERSAIETPPRDVRVIHSPDGENWTFLQTTVINANESTLVVEATPETDSLGTFAVVDDSNVQFEWSGDLPEVRGPTDAESSETLPSIATVGGVGVPTASASVLMSAGNSDLIDHVETAAGITEQIEDNRPTGFRVEDATFDEPGSKQITVTIIDANNRTATGNTTIDVVDTSSAAGPGSGSDDSSDDSFDDAETDTDTDTDADESTEGDEIESQQRDGDDSGGLNSTQSDEQSTSGDSSVSGADLFDQVDIPGGARIEIPETETDITTRPTSPQQLLIPGLISLMGILGSVVGYRTFSWKGILSRVQRNPRIVELGAPFCSHENHCLGVESLVAEDSSHPITHVDLSVVSNDGTRLITKAMQVESGKIVGKYQYTSDPATIQIPPSVSLNGPATYQIEVEIANQKGKTATEQTPEFTCSLG